MYFNSISFTHSGEGFGSIRQQFWVVLHYFLHIAILLTVEAQSALVIWNNCRRGISWFNARFPNRLDPARSATSTTDLVNGVRTCVDLVAKRFYYYKLTDYYNATTDIAKLSNVTAPYGSAEWNATVTPILNNIRYNIHYYIFVNFQAEGPMEIESTSDPALKVALYNTGFQVVFEYFYIAAGGLLLVLATMIWFGKDNKRKDEWLSIFVRIIIGLGLPFISILGFTETPGTTNSFRFREVQWIIPIVTFAYLGVLILDNLIKMAFSLKRRHKAKHSSDRRDSGASTLADEETGYAVDAETHQRKMHYAQLEDPQAHHTAYRRSSSQDSDIIPRNNTLEAMQGHHLSNATRGGRRYHYLTQEDRD